MDKSMDKNKYLLKNTAVFAFGSIGSKLISFFLVPLYTGVFTNAEYGITDLIYTLITVITPFVMFSMGEAIMRFSMDKDVDHDQILTITFITFVIGIFLSLFCIPILLMINTLSNYVFEIYLYIVLMATNSLVLCYLRGRERLLSYTFCSLLTTLLIAVFNIYYLLVLKTGIKGYLRAYILAYGISNIVGIVLGQQYRVIKKFKLNLNLWGKMFRFSLAVIPNSLMWWITNSSDRLMVTYIIGAAANGLYAVSYKVPTLITTLSTVFLNAWSYSAVKEEQNKEGMEYSNLIYDKLFSISCLLSAGMLFILKPLMLIYVSDSFYKAWKYSPFLILSSFFACISTFVGTPYFVNKDSKANLFSSVFGAAINIVMNLFLIPLIGINGAAISTCISYIAVYVYRIIDTKKYLKLIVIRKTHIIDLFLLSAMVLTIYLNFFISEVIMGIILSILFYVNRKLLEELIRIVIKKFMNLFTITNRN